MSLQVYPAMDLLGGEVVRLHQGRYDNATVYARDPLSVVDGFVAQGAGTGMFSRLHVVDLEGARDGVASQAKWVEAIVRRAKGLNVQVGGGIRTMEQIERYRDAGASRFVLGTAAVRDEALLRAACKVADVVVAVDARDGLVALQGWTETSTRTALEVATRARDAGARAILHTDIARDGTSAGPNLEATAALARALPTLEVIASGGVGSLDHLRAIAKHSEIAACVVGRALYDGTLTLESIREALS